MVCVLSLLCLFLLTSQAASYTQQIVYYPGLGEPKTYNFITDFNNTQVLRNFTDVVGRDSFTLESLEDSGFYVLQVETGSNGTYLDDNKIFQAVPAYLCHYNASEYLVQPVPSTFAIGRTAALPCTILGNPAPTFYWEKKVFDKYITVTPSARHYISPLGHLFIEKLEGEDAGTYRCTASNGCGQRCPGDMRCSGEKEYGDEVKLVVEHSASVVDNKTVRHFILNPVIDSCWQDDELVECLQVLSKGSLFLFRQFTSLNRTMNLEALVDYRRDTTDPDSVRSVRWVETDESIKNFKDLLEDRSGFGGACIAQIKGFKNGNSKQNYYCASYLHNKLMHSRVFFTVALRELPKIQLPGGIKGQHMTKLMEFQAGKQLKLYVQLSSNRYNMNDIAKSWSCEWNGELITKDWHSQCEFNKSESDIVTITIDYAVSSDSGFYQVYANNEEGYAVGPPVMVKVIGEEDHKGKYVLKPTLLAENTIDIEWKRPSCNVREPYCDAQFNYTVAWKNMVWDEPVMTANTTNLAYSITGLNPGVQYEVKVTTGQSSLVANTKILTTKSILPECEVKPFFSNVSTDYIEVYWEEYNKKLLHGHFKGYEIRVQSNTKPIIKTEPYRVHINKLYLDHVIPYTSYDVSVTPCNEKGCTLNYHSYRVKTKEARPDSPPQVYKIVSSYWSINVSMVFPSTLPGELSVEVDLVKDSKDFNMKERSAADFTNETRALRTYKTKQFSLEDLKANSKYYFRIRLRTKAGAGPFTEYFSQKTSFYINETAIYIGISVFSLILTVVVAITLYIKRKYPGMAKSVYIAIRNKIRPIYSRPQNTRPPWERLGDKEDEHNNIIIKMTDDRDILSKPSKPI